MLVGRNLVIFRGVMKLTYYPQFRGIEGSVEIVADFQGSYCLRSFNMACVEA